MSDNRDELLKLITENVNQIVNKKKTLAEVKTHLLQNRITEGRVEEVLSNPEIIEDQRELALFTEQFYVKTGIESLNPNKWFTDAEMKEAKQYDFIITNSEELIKFPWEITALPGKDGGYVSIISSQMIAKLMKSHKLNYNLDIQREAKRVKRKNNIFEYTPTIDKKNVKAIRELMLKGEVERTTITFNAAPRTGKDDVELIYDNKTLTLTITEGTRLDILDGFHRCLACQEVYEIDSEIESFFTLDITNKTTRQAQRWQAQTAKGTRISKARILEMEDTSRVKGVIQLLKSESELRGRISSRKGRVNAESGELVNYLILSDAIDRNFKLQNKSDEYEVAEYLTKFFEYLMSLYPQEFGDYKNRDKHSLMYYNKMFAGYVALAAKMQKENIAMKELAELMNKIDFSRSNPIWMKLGIIDENGVITKNAKEEKIENYFIGLIEQSKNKKKISEMLN